MKLCFERLSLGKGTELAFFHGKTNFVSMFGKGVGGEDGEGLDEGGLRFFVRGNDDDVREMDKV